MRYLKLFCGFVVTDTRVTLLALVFCSWRRLVKWLDEMEQRKIRVATR